MYNIFIIGAGYTGSAIARHFQKKNQRVFGLVRTPESAKRLEREGILPVVADLTKPETLKEIPSAHFIVFSAAPKNRNEEAYRKIYLEGVGNILEAMKNKPRPLLIVYLSSTGVYPDMKGALVGEETLFAPDSKRGRVLFEAERLVLNSGFASIIFRLSGIYGPRRNRIRALREGTWTYPEKRSYINMIHVEDIVEAVALLFKKGKEGNAYLGVDDEPVENAEFYRWVSSELGIIVADEAEIGKTVVGKQCSNKKLKNLGFNFRYPTFREGYLSFMDAEKETSGTEKTLKGEGP